MSRSHLERGPRLELQHKPPEKQTNETTQPNKTTKPKKGMMMLTLVLNVDYVSKRQVRSFHPATLARGAEWKSLDWRANWWMELFCGNETWKGNCKFVYHALLCHILYNVLVGFQCLVLRTFDYEARWRASMWMAPGPRGDGMLCWTLKKRFLAPQVALVVVTV